MRELTFSDSQCAEDIADASDVVVVMMRNDDVADGRLFLGQNALQVLDVLRMVGVASVKQNPPAESKELRVEHRLSSRLSMTTTYFDPLPIKYVLVPWRVVTPGLQPRIRISEGVIRVTAGMCDNIVDPIFSGSIN